MLLIIYAPNVYIIHMIDELTPYAYCCEDISKIENYDIAVNDSTQRYVCHHRKGTDLKLTREELKAAGLYFNRPADELIFLTVSEHARLHQANLSEKQKLEKSERSRQAIIKVNKTYWKGRKWSDHRKTEQSQLMAEYRWWTDGTKCVRAKDCPGEGWIRGRNGYAPNKGVPMSDEQKKKLSTSIKGKKKWNNGTVNMYSEQCPGDNWVRGFLPKYH